MRVLNLACGKVILPDWVNVDRRPHPGMDVLLDLERPWSFKDDTFDRVWASHVLEHVLDLVHTMEELHRVLKPGGVLFARVPYGFRGWLATPAHIRPFFLNSMATFCHQDAMSLDFDRQWRQRQAFVSDYYPPFPFPWHVRRYLPWFWSRFARSSWPDGRERCLVPLGPRKEITFVLEAVK